LARIQAFPNTGGEYQTAPRTNASTAAVRTGRRWIDASMGASFFFLLPSSTF